MSDASHWWKRSLIILVVFIVIILLIIAFLPSSDNSQSTASPKPTPDPTPMPTPTSTATLSSTPTATLSPTDTPTPPSPAEVYFLDLEYSTPESEPYLAGFKVDSESFDKAINQVYGQNYTESFFEHYNIEQGVVYAEVRAECWVGNITQRPADPTKRVGLKQKIRRGQDTWVLGEIPRRNDVKEDRYICLFGFQNSSLDIFSGSNETGIQVKIHDQKVRSQNEVEEKPRVTVVSEPFKEFPSSEHPIQLYHDSHCSTDPKPETCPEGTYFSIS